MFSNLGSDISDFAWNHFTLCLASEQNLFVSLNSLNPKPILHYCFLLSAYAYDLTFEERQDQQT
jgi:hypothetical protein